MTVSSTLMCKLTKPCTILAYSQAPYVLKGKDYTGCVHQGTRILGTSLVIFQPQYLSFLLKVFPIVEARRDLGIQIQYIRGRTEAFVFSSPIGDCGEQAGDKPLKFLFKF